MRATDGTLRLGNIARDRQQLALQVIAATVVFALAVGLFLLQRRFSGALSTPLPVLQLIATGALVAAWAVAVSKLSRATPTLTAIAFVAILLIALACSYPGSRIVDWLVWPTAMFAAALFPLALPLAATRHRSAESPSAPNLIDAETEPEHVLQQITRTRNADGTEAIRATLVGEFNTGERQTTLHIAFCPPFERLPEVEANLNDDLDATVKLTQVLQNGAQIEVRLAEPAEELLHVGIELFATDASPS
jgi:hypothetical protein